MNGPFTYGVRDHRKIDLDDLVEIFVGVLVHFFDQTQMFFERRWPGKLTLTSRPVELG